MLSSNQYFQISGDLRKVDTLKSVIRLLHDNYHFHFNSYCEIDGDLVFYAYTENSEVTQIDKDNQNTDYLVNLISLHMSSKSFKTALNKLQKDTDYLDGGTSEGWLVEVKPHSFSECVVIKPFWVFYSK